MAEKKRSSELQDVLTTSTTLPDLKLPPIYQGLKVVGLVADNSACGYYRVILPLHLLKCMGATVSFSSISMASELKEYDYIICPRQHNMEVLEAVYSGMWDFKIPIFEIDDDLHSVEHTNPAFSVYHQGSAELVNIQKFIEACYGWTTTTPELAKRYYRYNRNPVIIPNFIDFSLRDWNTKVTWTKEVPHFEFLPSRKPEEAKDKIRILYSGGSTHSQDLEQIGGTIRDLLLRIPHVEFCFNSSRQLYEEFLLKFNIPRERTKFIPPSHFLDYPKKLHEYDIALAPVECTQFNLCKSDLRIKEMMAAGCAVVASNVGPYARFNAANPNMVNLVGNGGKFAFGTWGEALMDLISNEQKLKERQVRGRELVASRYSLEANVHLWPNAWGLIHEARDKGNLGPDPKVTSRDSGWYRSFGQAGRNDPCPCGSGGKYKKCCGKAFG